MVRSVGFISILLLAFLPSFSLAYPAGDGSSTNPYQIAAPADWIQLMNTPAHWASNFILTADLDLNGNNLTPVGNNSTRFTGVFDGNRHIISNAIINLPSNDYVSLFGSLGSGGQLFRLGVENIAITAKSSVGGLCGQNNGGIISQCYATGSITSMYFSYILGGLCGHNIGGSITHSYALVSISIKDRASNVGGLCGFNEGGSIQQCYASGSVMGNSDVGGLCGRMYSNGSITDSYWDIDSSGQSASDGGWGLTSVQMKQAASFPGWNDGSWTINEALDTPRLTWESRPGAILSTDWPTPPYVGSGTETEPYQISSVTDLLGISRRTPDWSKHFILTNDIDLDGLTFSNAIISYCSDFNGVFDGNGHVIKNLNIGGGNYLGLFYRLGPIGKITHLRLEECNVQGSNQYAGGLVGWSSGTISSCSVTGIVRGAFVIGGLIGQNSSGTVKSCHVAGTIIGDGSHIGGLIGRNESGIISSSHVVITVSGVDSVGGLVGSNGGTIKLCSAAGTVTKGNKWIGGLVGLNEGTITSSYATNNVNGNFNIGGLVGGNWDTINYCYATGNVCGGDQVGGLCGENWNGTITSSYSTCPVSGTSYIGGLLGYKYSGTITTSFWDTESSHKTIGVGYGSDAGILGKTTLEMKTRSTFTDAPANWDFLGESINGENDYWRMCVDGVQYPKLTWQYGQAADFDCPDGTGPEDAALFFSAWLSQPADPAWNPRCDLNSDSIINLLDYHILAQYWLTSP